MILMISKQQKPWSSVLEMLSWKESMVCAGCRYFEREKGDTGFCTCPGGNREKIRVDADEPACCRFQY